MLVKSPLFWIAALAALVIAVWYRDRVYRKPPVPESATVVFITGGSGPYWQMTANGAKAAAVDFNVDLKIEMPADESVAEQAAILTKVRRIDHDGVAISPLDAERQTNIINQFASETNVVTFDSDAPLSQRQCYVGTSNYSAGQLCANLVHEAVPDGGKVAVLLANETKSNLIDRKAGFEESINVSPDPELGVEAGDAEAGSSEYEVVGYFVDDGDSGKTVEIIRKALADHPDLSCFVGMNAQHGPLLLKTLEEDGKLGQVQLVTFDEEEETLAGVESGHVFATIAQDPFQYGYESVRMLRSLHQGDRTLIPIVGRGSILIAAEAIRKDNLEDFRSRLKSRSQPVEEPEAETAAAAAG